MRSRFFFSGSAEAAADSAKPASPKVSHHQPCPNHVGGKTFSEMGTQTAPRPKKRPRKKEQLLDPHGENEGGGCAVGLKMR